MKKLGYLYAISFCLLISCNQKNEQNFTYSEFKEALYYNNSTSSFSELGNLEMCINRWGLPKYIKSMGTYVRTNITQLPNNNSQLNTIVFKWTNIKVDGKNVEIYFQMDRSGKTIERLYTGNGISLNNSKHAIVSEFRLTQN